MSEDNNKIIKANDDYMINIVQKRIKKNEGYSGTPYTLKYKDKEEKFTTGGFGHRMANNTAASQEDVLTKEGWEQVFQDDFKKATKGAERLLNGATIPVEAFGVLTEMVFQMGEAGVAGFPTMLKHLKAGNTIDTGRSGFPRRHHFFYAKGSTIDMDKRKLNAHIGTKVTNGITTG